MAWRVGRATITPVSVRGEPEKLNPEIQPLIEQHYAMATKVMKEEGVTINDLDALLRPHLNLLAGANRHSRRQNTV